MTPSAPPLTRRVLEIDALRFVAALMVVAFHWAFRGGATGEYMSAVYPPLLPAAQYGYLGVELFFMISGFVILMSAQGRDVRAFAISRIVRLYPAFWACCTLTALGIVLFADRHFHVGAVQYLLNMTLLSGLMPVNVASVDGVYWSLLVELRFYFFVALVVALGWLRHTERLLWLWLGVAAALQAAPPTRVSAWLITPYAALFVGGACCYLVYSAGITRARLLLLGASFVLALRGVVAGAAEVAHRYPPYQLSPWVAAGLLALFYLVMFTVAVRGIGLLRHPAALACGALTYPLYLLHQNLGFIALNRLHGVLPAHVSMLLVLAGALLLAWLVNRFVERPATPRLKAALEPASGGRRLPAPAARG